MNFVMPCRVAARLVFLVVVLATWPLAAQEKSADGLQAVITTAADEQISAHITALRDGQLQLATQPPRSMPLADVARIDVGAELARAPVGTDLDWIGQDNHDLVQVGGASGGNGIQDLHLHAKNLRSVGIKQITVVCRFPKQLRVWRFDTSQSPHWRLAIARADLAPEAELYIEPAAIDGFGQEFKVSYTYNDGIKTTAQVVATTHTSDRLKINRRARAGSTEPPPDGKPSDDGGAEVYLADSGLLRGQVVKMDAESLTLRTKWGFEVRIPLLRVAGVAFVGDTPGGGLADFKKAMAAPESEDLVFVAAEDKSTDSIQLSVQGLNGDQLSVRYQDEERSINRDRVVAIVFAAHPPGEKLANPHQIFFFAGGDRMTGHWVGFNDGKLEIETAWHARIRVPATEVGQIRVRGGKLTFLPDLEPVAVEEVPYFGRLIPWRRDAGFDGAEAKLRGKSPTRVVAMHSRCVLTYALGGEYERFKATLGFDDSAGDLGRVDCRVLVDGREAFAREDFRAGQDPIPVDVALAGAQQISLEVDYGVAEDVGDRILWVEPRLFRADDK